jgi:hypothetical protein
LALPDSAVDRLHREVGVCMHLAQVLETSIVALITMSRHGLSEAEADLVLPEDRLTLGVLMRDVGKAGLDQVGMDALSEALDARNYVAHQIFIRHTHAFEDQHAYDAALSTLEAKQHVIAAAVGLMLGLSQGFAAGTRTRVLVRQDTPPPQETK